MGSENTNEVMTHFTSAVYITYVIEYLKASGWCPWLTADTTTVNRWVSIACAIAVGFGITGTWTPGAGGTIHIPPAADLLAHAFDAAKQFAVQQFVYDTAIAKSPVPVTVHVVPPGPLATAPAEEPHA